LFLGPDPGWNDPPTFSYDKATEIQTNAYRKGVTLNKRVAYPMSTSNRPISTGGIDPTLPPSNINVSQVLPPPSGIPTVSTLPTPEKTCDEENVHDRLQEVLGNFQKVCDFEVEEEICKRIKLLENMWLEGKLNAVVQRRLLELSKGRYKNKKGKGMTNINILHLSCMWS